MLTNIQPETQQRKARSDLEEIKHSLKMLDKISQQLDSLSNKTYGPERQVSLQRSEKLKFDIKQKLRSMGSNINQMITGLDYKMSIILKQLVRMQRNIKLSTSQKKQKKMSNKSEEEYKYQINQLEQRIFQLQKRQNQYVKQISELKQKNAKLRQQFTNLSFDSNQRIKQLSQKLHNNTSPNLTIKRIAPNPNHDNSYLLSNQDRKSKNNFVKIKGANYFDQEVNPLEMSPASNGRKGTNMLDSMTSQSSQYDIRAMGYQLPQNQQNSGNLRFGCFPGKQTSQKTKTGSSSQNKKMVIQDKYDKGRRFEFLLNNLIDRKDPGQQNQINRQIPGGNSYGQFNIYNGSNKGGLNNQAFNTYQYKSLSRNQSNDQYKSVFNQNVIKKYQI